MTWDGLNDIVLVHNGRIDYWPNMGYGKFGKRITMDRTPRLEWSFVPDRFCVKAEAQVVIDFSSESVLGRIRGPG